MSVAKSIQLERLKRGFSQQYLASKGGVSVSTLQKIEAGSVSPSIDTLESLFSALGLRLGYEPAPIDWDELAALGVPLTARTDKKTLKSQQKLIDSLLITLSAIDRNEQDCRESKALLATLWAIKLHYPSLYKKELGNKDFLKRWLDKPISGELIKLYRLALANIQEYL
jgi:transcriptional regulator with XRE-family HTH domain